MAEFCCPCCGAPMASRPPIDALKYARLTPLTRRLVDTLVSAYPKPVYMEALINAAYFDRPDGGPEWASSSIKATLWRNNARLRRYGWRVAGRSYGTNSVALEEVPK